MTFKSGYNGGNCNGCEWLAAQGVIAPGSAAALEAAIKKRGGCYIVTLNSPGGSLVEGLRMGEILRKHGCTTTIGSTTLERYDAGPYSITNDTMPGECLSACAFAFIGGKTRRVSKGNHFGVHQHYDPSSLNAPLAKTLSANDASTSQLLTGLLVSYATKMGVDPLLISIASVTRPTDPMYILSERELRTLRVVTDVEPMPGQWALVPHNGALAARIQHEQMEDLPQGALLFCSAHPDGRKVTMLMVSVDARGGDSELYTKLMQPESQPFTIKTSDNKTIESKQYLVRYEGGGRKGTVHYGIPLSETELRSIGRSGTFSWLIDSPRSVAHLFFGTIAGTGLGPMIPFLLRNCLPVK